MSATSVDEYVDSFDEEVRSIVVEIRRLIHAAVPDGVESITYGIPTVKVDDRYVVYFAGWKHHVSVYPLPNDLGNLADELAPYTSGKGTAKFMIDRPIPYDLIRRLVALIAQERGVA